MRVPRNVGRTVPFLVAALVGGTLVAMGAGENALAAGAAAPHVAAAVPTFTNGQIAYSCLTYGGTVHRDGWITASASGSAPAFHAWPWGTYSNGAHWSADGSEMVHRATYGPPDPTQTTVFLSEADASFPWWNSNYSGTAGLVDDQATFTADGKHVLFQRNQRILSNTLAGEDTPPEIIQPAGQNQQPTASVTGDIAFEHEEGGTTPNVYYLAVGAAAAVDLGPGAMPRFSPDGTKIAFENISDGRFYEMNLDGSSVTMIGPSVSGQFLGDFAWSPDGTTLLISAGAKAIESAVLPAGSATTVVGGTQCSGGAYQVSWQPLPTVKDRVIRASGTSREGTAIAISKTAYPTDHTADAVVLADSLHFPDALSGGPLATKVNGPLLLTPGQASTVYAPVLAEIARVLKPGATQLYLLGGLGSLSQGIETQLTNAGYTIKRFAGLNREDTSLQIAQFLGQGASAPEELLLATGTDFPDGLSAGAAAASYWSGPSPTGGAVILTAGTKLTPQAQAYIAAAIAGHTDPAHKVYVTTVGGLADKAYSALDRISCVGADRYATSACVAYVHFGAQPDIAVATGTSFPDALAGGSFAGALNAPLLLIPPDLTTDNDSPYLLHIESSAISTAYVFGGTGVVSLATATQLRSIIGIGTTYTAQGPTVTSASARAASATAAATGSRRTSKAPPTPAAARRVAAGRPG